MSDKNQSNKKRLRVLLPLPLKGAFEYLCPDHIRFPEHGCFVRVPFGNRTMVGVVWDSLTQEEVEEEKLKNILEVLDFPVLPRSNRRLIDWVSDYTLSAPGSVLKMAMSVDSVFDAVKEIAKYVKAADFSDDILLTPARRKVLDILGDEARSASDIARLAKVSVSVVTGLIKSGVLHRSESSSVIFGRPETNSSSVCLSDKQTSAARLLSGCVGNGFSVTVLNGVTGSGKTEVYFDMIATVLNQNRQALILLPEIGLTGQWLERFRRRFSVMPAVWHSGLTPKVRRETWKAVLNGSVRVLAGARSSLFLPFNELGAIIVDEEHDASYKQEDGVVYQARDMAVVRAKIENIPIVLSSATPSLETRINVRNGKYKEVVLPNRFGNAVMPDVELVDMRRFPPEKNDRIKSFLSPVLLEEIKRTLSRKEQVLLFLNRRGYAPLVLCRECGYRFQCPHCSAWLVEHKKIAKLQCHHCGYSLSPPSICPVCGQPDTLTSCGPGVERISEEMEFYFPQAKQLVVSTDLNVTSERMADLMRRIGDHEVDLVIGTQILTKGHHFPDLTLVGVVDADLGLSGGDLRAGERTFQMLNQVAGRAGREDKKGHVFLQTFDPDNQIMQSLKTGDADRFFAAEIQSREMLNMPPFGRLAGVIVSSFSQDYARKAAELLGKSAPCGNGVRTLGPVPAPMALLRGKYRYRLLLQTGKHIRIQEILKKWLSRFSFPASVRIQTDVDPYSFF